MMVGGLLGHYRLLARIGAGGMGEVYRALDTRLNRPVAIKVLPPELTGDPERRLRFQREAQAAAALNHPNICTIHAVEQHDGVDFLVMELLEGETLRERIGHRPMPLRELLPLVIQVGEALVAAHARGVLHRDLKPDNVFVTQAGVAKVLDFGLAKVLHPEREAEAAREVLSQLETISRELTVQGKVFGTVAYMSPEQAKGEKVTHHSDLFSFGVVLYEMAAGRPPFRGKTDAETLASIIKEEAAPLSAVTGEPQPELERIIGKCLEKDLADRYHHADEIVSDLRRLKRATDSGVQAVRTPAGAVSAAPRGVWGRMAGRRGTRPAAAALAVALVAAGVYQAVRVSGKQAGGSATTRAGEHSSPPRFSFSQITRDPALEAFPSLSPDGKSLAYASNARGNFDIYLLRVGGQNPINLTASSGANNGQPAFSPDGERIAFWSDRDGGGIFVMGATGESVRRVTTAGFYPAWSPDGGRIAYATSNFGLPAERGGPSEIWAVDLRSGAKERLAAADSIQPSWSPRGDRIAYWSNTGGQRDIWTIAATGGPPVRVTNDGAVDWNPVWSADGRQLWFVSDRGGAMNLWRVRIDETSGKPLGEPEPVTLPSASILHVAFAPAKERFVFVSSSTSQNIRRIGFDPAAGRVAGPSTPVTSGARRDAFASISPDGAWLAFFSWEVQEDIHLVRPDGTELRQLTDDLYKDRMPRFSPDGKRIAFHSNRGGAWDIWTMDRDGGDLRPITNAPGEKTHPVWAPDGTRIAFRMDAATCMLDLAGTAPDRRPEALPPLDGAKEHLWPWDWSPDGREIVGVVQCGNGGVCGTFVYSLAAKTYRRVSDASAPSRWTRDGRQILSSGPGGLLLIGARTEKAREILKPEAGEEVGAPFLSPDQKTLYYISVRQESDLWLAEAQ